MMFSTFRRSIPQVYTFSFLLLAAILLSFILLHPTVASRWNPYYRKYYLDKFISELKATKQVDPQKYWEFRERYSPGHMEFNGNVIGIFQNYRIDTLPETGSIELMTYHSPLIKSVDRIAPEGDSRSVFDLAPGAEIIFVTDSIELIQTDSTHILLNFVLPIEEMRKANGFFDYLPQEQKLLEGKHWLNSTTIEIQ